MKTLRYRTTGNFKVEQADLEIIKDTVSATIPGQSYTVREIVDRYVRGTAPMVGLPAYYDEPSSFDDEDPTKLPDFDLSDIDQTKRKLNLRARAKRSAEEAAEQAKLEKEKLESDSLASDKKQAQLEPSKQT